MADDSKKITIVTFLKITQELPSQPNADELQAILTKAKETRDTLAKDGAAVEGSITVGRARYDFKK